MSPRPYRVLSLDGGGMRGLYTVKVLQTLIQRFRPNGSSGEMDLGKAFDLIVGTSTGGILACALAAGIPISKIVGFYRDQGPKIFKAPMPKSYLLQFFWMLRHLFAAADDAVALRHALESCFGQMNIGELWEKRNIGICIPSVNLQTQKAWVFKTPHNPLKHRDNRASLVDVCLASSAAPIFLPVAVVSDPDSSGMNQFFADGGLWANNPVLIGLIEALEMAKEDQKIEIVSVGTCSPPQGAALTKSKADWGVLKWKVGSGALATSLDTQSSGYDFMSKFLIPHLKKPCTIFRLQPTPPSSDQAAHLALDLATEKAFEVLSNLAQNDANAIHGNALRDQDAGHVLIRDIFTNLKPLE